MHIIIIKQVGRKAYKAYEPEGRIICILCSLYLR